MQTEKEKKYNKWIWILSIAIPLAVAALFKLKIPNAKPLTFLPPIYATINGITAIILIVAVMQIKKGNRLLHERLMKFAILLSCLFLVMYVAYHATSTETIYGDANNNGVLCDAELAHIGAMRTVYIIILLSHIALSIGVIPLVLITYVKALSERFDKHKKIAKITFPIWLYVAITGVVVYLMISPYYA